MSHILWENDSDYEATNSNESILVAPPNSPADQSVLDEADLEMNAGHDESKSGYELADECYFEDETLPAPELVEIFQRQESINNSFSMPKPNLGSSVEKSPDCLPARFLNGCLVSPRERQALRRRTVETLRRKIKNFQRTLEALESKMSDSEDTEMSTVDPAQTSHRWVPKSNKKRRADQTPERPRPKRYLQSSNKQKPRPRATGMIHTDNARQSQNKQPNADQVVVATQGAANKLRGVSLSEDAMLKNLNLQDQSK